MTAKAHAVSKSRQAQVSGDTQAHRQKTEMGGQGVGQKLFIVSCVPARLRHEIARAYRYTHTHTHTHTHSWNGRTASSTG